MDNEKLNIPNQEQIEKLNPQAQVAFATRCAQRVRPLFIVTWPCNQEECFRDLDNALDLAKQYYSQNISDTMMIKNYATSIEDTTRDAANACEKGDTRKHVYEVAKIVLYVVNAVMTAKNTNTSMPSLSRIVKTVVDKTIEIFENHEKAINGIKRDFESITQPLADINSPINPAIFGPLWPDGEPDWTVFE